MNAPPSADEKDKPEKRQPPPCHFTQPDGRQGCGGYPTWCSICDQWTYTCCQDYGTCQCS